MITLTFPRLSALAVAGAALCSFVALAQPRVPAPGSPKFPLPTEPRIYELFRQKVRVSVVAHGIEVPLLHRSTRKLVALYRGLPPSERDTMLHALIDSLTMKRPSVFRNFLEAEGAAQEQRRVALSHFAAEHLQAAAGTP